MRYKIDETDGRVNRMEIQVVVSKEMWGLHVLTLTALR